MLMNHILMMSHFDAFLFICVLCLFDVFILIGFLVSSPATSVTCMAIWDLAPATSIEYLPNHCESDHYL